MKIFIFGMLAGMVTTRIKELATAAGYKRAHHFGLATGLSPSRASALFNDRQTGLDFDTIDFLCGFFDCAPGDLFVRVTAEAKTGGVRSGQGRAK